MQALYFDGDRRLRLDDVPVPEPAAGEVLVRVAYSGVCQTDVRFYVGNGSKALLGHEFSGRVVECGPGAKRFSVGDRVTCYPFLYCGECPTCQAGLQQVCPHRNNFNEMPQGGYAEYMAFPEGGFMPLPDDIDDAHGTLVLDVFGMLHQALKLTGLKAGNTCAIVGLQPYGLGGVCLAKRLGAKVVAFDASPFRRELGKSLGADVVVDSAEPKLVDIVRDLTDGLLFDQVAECDDPAIPIASLPTWVKPGGVLCLEGHTGQSVPLTPVQLTIHQLTITGTPLYAPSELDAVHQAIRDCPQAQRIITHRPKPADAKAALDDYADGRAGKVAIDFT